jgi:hypothetical protein
MTESEFIERYKGPTIELSVEDSDTLNNPRFRAGFLRLIHQDQTRDASGLLRAILQREVIYRKGEGVDEGEREGDDYFENIYWCAFLLWRVGDLGDVIELWRAKKSSFDTWCAFDIQFLIGAGLDETIRYLQVRTDPESREALERILDSKCAGSFDDMKGWETFIEQYHRG